MSAPDGPELMLHDVPAVQNLQKRIRRDRKEGRDVSRDASRLSQRLDASESRVKKRAATRPRIAFPDALPIREHLDAIRTAVADHPVVIVAGDTGSGKTTQLPKLLLEMGYGIRGMIGCTQPRRIAATSVTARVGHELGIKGTSHVAYQVRFDNKTTPDTLIKFMTDGILLTETQSDADLLAYDAIIIDEVHERSLNIDFLLGYLKRLLVRRPELKIIISSATLEVERFSGFFNDAPVVSVPGKTFPVELLYWEPDDSDSDLATDVARAIDDITELAPGQNVLVFLTGEQDIRETARILEGRQYASTDILPLYSRLPAGEQKRAFIDTPRRRIILATNVAETSLTIPGIHVVVDAGVARMKRYNHRTQVEKLHIEPVSQASARQRLGRCGRVGPGLCIRLYGQKDFERRPEFTDPEITRSSLASVILNMLSLRLGRIEEFPFLDPPSPAMIKDGYRELHELQALTEEQTLTDTGRKLARFSMEPRLGRMLIEGDRQKILPDVLTVVSGLSIDDPRLRPMDRRDEADTAHKAFQTETSDFAGFLLLWSALETHGHSNTRLRSYCRNTFLSYRRVREWRFVRKQIAEECKTLRLSLKGAAATDESLHRSVLAGLLNRIGIRHEDGGYRGARNVRFHIHPGSGMKRKTPEWIVAAELTETSRVFGRYSGVIQADWIEPLARHVCKHRYGEPYWDPDTGYVRAEEFVTLYGLPISEGRRRHYGDIDHEASRKIFIQSGLVEGQLHKIPEVIQANLDSIRALAALEAKQRKRDLLVPDSTIFALYSERVPKGICNLKAFNSWLYCDGDEARAHLTFSEHELLLRDTTNLSQEDYPDAWIHGDNRFPLRYRFKHGAEDDGVTCSIPLQALPELRAEHFEWLVPGLLPEKIELLLRGIPKRYRRVLIPMAETVQKATTQIEDRSAALATTLDTWILRTHGMRIPPDEWTHDIPTHLRMRFEITDDNEVVDHSRDLAALQQKWHTHSNATVSAHAAFSEWTESGLTEWTFGTLSRDVQVSDGQWAARRYPGIRDDGESVSLQLYATPYEAQQACRYGLARLAMFAMPKDIKQLQSLPPFKRDVNEALLLLGLGKTPLHEHIIIRAVSQACAFDGPALPETRADFETCIATARPQFYPLAREIFNRTTAHLTHVTQLLTRLTGLESEWQLAARNDIETQIRGLFHRTFLLTTRDVQLNDTGRYLKAIDVRLERLAHAAPKDASRLEQITPFVDPIARPEDGERNQEALAHYLHMLQEFRVSLFAQELGTRMPISAKRLEKQWAKVVARG